MTAALPLSDRDGKIWMDGQLIDWRDARVHVLTHTPVSYTHLTLPTNREV